MSEREPLLRIEHLSKVFKSKNSEVRALDDVSLTIHVGESVGLVGESGSGKSTIARIVAALEKATEGSIVFDGQQVVGAKPAELRRMYRSLSMVFQNPTDSFNPRRTLGSSMIDAAPNNGISRREAQIRIPALLRRVGLTPEYASRYPHQVSGGECQRVGIARAIAFEPKLLICDEATSALDVNVQAQIVGLLRELMAQREMALLFICHDLTLVRALCETCAVLLSGSVVEVGNTKQVVDHPMNPYTRLMVQSVFPVQIGTGWQIPHIELREAGRDSCRFYARCTEASDKCAGARPPLFEVPEPDGSGMRQVACWLYE